MIYKFRYVSKSNVYNNLYIVINNETREFIIFKSSMFGEHLYNKIKRLTGGLDLNELVNIDLKTRKDFEKQAFILREDNCMKEV